jgi:ABC-type antimicrobial peptide transport system permease subunit
MFLTYLRRELRRRMRQAVFICLGLALGIGLVITVTAASSGVKAAQQQVLENLYGVGTSATVTRAPTSGSLGAGTGRRFTFKPGATVRIDQLTASRTLGSLSQSAVTTISRLRGVAAAAGALTATNVDTTFKIPDFGGGGFGSGSGRSGSSGSFRGPVRFNPGNSVSVSGVDLSPGAGQALGPLSNGTLTSGRTLRPADARSDVAVIDSGYARSAKLRVGSDVTLGGSRFRVVGIVSDSASSSAPDVYIPLARAQALSGMTGKVNEIFVSAASSASVASVKKEIQNAVPGVTVTTSADLASAVTGSVTSASSLANSLGRWLAVAVLVAAFLLASLLMMAAVSRRVREFGTLKALGWRTRRVLGQVLGESVTLGLIGGAAGIGLGFAGAKIVSSVTGPLTASLGPTTGSATPGGARVFGGGFPGGGPGGAGGPGGFFRRAAAAAPHTTVHLATPVSVNVILLAVALAVAGGLIAGLVGGWRAARLRPAAALARVA